MEVELQSFSCSKDKIPLLLLHLFNGLFQDNLGTPAPER